MRHLYPVLWNKGTFLQAHHLQQQDLYIESQISFLTDAMVGYSYGFYSLTIDDAALAKGYFSLAEASGRFPDGGLFDLAAHPPAPLLVGEFPQGDRSIVISLAVPHLRNQGKNVSNGGTGVGTTRYRAEVVPVRDETTGSSERHIQVGHQNLSYLSAQFDQSLYSTLPAVRLIYNGGKLQVDRTFVPPLVRVAASPHLQSTIQAWASALADRSKELARHRQIRGSYAPDSGPSDVQNFWMLYTVNSFYPKLKQFLLKGSVHPATAYCEASALAGALTSFSLEVDPGSLPAYNHDDIGGCFNELDAVISRLLETAIRRNYVVLPLVQTQGERIWSTHLKDEYLEGSHVYLAVESEPQPGWAIPDSWVTDTVQVVAGTDVRNLRSQSLLGLPLTKIDKISRGPMQAGYRYYRLDTSHSTWANIRQSRNLAVNFPLPPLPRGRREEDRKEPGLELVIVLRKPV